MGGPILAIGFHLSSNVRCTLQILRGSIGFGCIQGSRRGAFIVGWFIWPLGACVRPVRGACWVWPRVGGPTNATVPTDWGRGRSSFPWGRGCWSGLWDGSVGGAHYASFYMPGGSSVGRLLGAVEIAVFLLFFYIFDAVTNAIGSRGTEMSVRGAGIPLRRVLGRVRRRASCLFVCSGGVSIGRHASVHISRGPISRILGGLLKGGVTCRVRNVRVVLSSGERGRATVTRRTGGVRIGNGIASVTNRPIVNTDVLRGKAAGNVMASFGNSFSLGMGPNTILIISCVNCSTRRMGIVPKGILGVGVGRSTRLLSRIIMINCKARGGIGLANTVRAISTSIVRGHPVHDTASTLRNAMSKLAMASNANGPKRFTSFGVQNGASIGDTNTLIVVSKVPKSVGAMGPRSVRAVSILGSTTSTTVCNTETTRKIILIAAGGKASRGIGMRCAKGFSFGAPAHLPRDGAKLSRTLLSGITFAGTKLTIPFSRGTVSTVGSPGAVTVPGNGR